MSLALCPWKPVEALLYEKELLPVGPVTKWVNGEKQVTDVDIKLSFIERIAKQFEQFKAVGVRVPLFKTHIEDPDNDRGTVEDVFIKTNPSGVPSLYGRIRFSSEEAAAKGKNVDVSVMCPPKFVDGKGNTYEFPLRHVALTSIPVVPGLEPFQPIVLSFDTESGLMLAEENLETVDTGEEAPAEDLPAEDALIMIASMVGADLSLGNQALVDAIAQRLGGEEGDGDIDGEEPSASLEAAHTPAPAAPNKRILSQLAEARRAQIQGLVTSHVISPALAKKWEERFVRDEALILDFTSESDDPTRFDDAVALAHDLANDRPISRPTARTVVAKQPSDDDANLPATVRDAKRRAAAAAKHKA